jgi:hypothetical protein
VNLPLPIPLGPRHGPSTRAGAESRLRALAAVSNRGCAPRKSPSPLLPAWHVVAPPGGTAAGGSLCTTNMQILFFWKDSRRLLRSRLTPQPSPRASRGAGPCGGRRVRRGGPPQAGRPGASPPHPRPSQGLGCRRGQASRGVIRGRRRVGTRTILNQFNRGR